MKIIQATNLCRYYGRRVGIRSVDLSVGRGELFGFLGPNGAGKTTTIRLLMGMMAPTSGKAQVFGRDCWTRSRQVKQDVGYVPGDLRLYSWMTVRRALKIASRVRGCDLFDDGQRIAKQFDLDLDLRVRSMSRGMRQKLGLLLAIVHRPQLLILDEPTTGLDPLMQEQITHYLRQYAADGHTVFFSSHTLSEVETLCDRVAIVRRGEIVSDSSIRSLKKQAPRRVKVVFREAEQTNSTEVPGCLAVDQRNLHSWTGDLVGEPMELVRWAGAQNLADLEIGKPDLEHLFHKYYKDDWEVVT